MSQSLALYVVVSRNHSRQNSPWVSRVFRHPKGYYDIHNYFDQPIKSTVWKRTLREAVNKYW